MWKAIAFKVAKYLIVKLGHRLIVDIVLERFSDQEKMELLNKLNEGKYL